jgi:hypothetical protein
MNRSFNSRSALILLSLAGSILLEAFQPLSRVSQLPSLVRVRERYKSQSCFLQKNPRNEHDADLLHRHYHSKYLMRNERYDYIIIGSGIGGLWLAAALAKCNRTSLVLEQHSIAGGFQHTFRRGPYEFVPALLRSTLLTCHCVGHFMKRLLMEETSHRMSFKSVHCPKCTFERD